MLSKVKSLLQYSSDLHLERGFQRTLNITKPYLLLGGDIGCPFDLTYKQFLLNISQYYEKIFLLSGNHEYIGGDVNKIDLYIRNICEMRNNLFFIQKETHSLCKENNIILAGCTLWSSKPLSKYEHHLDHKRWLTNLINNNPNNNYVIGTHHCPLYECLNSRSTTPNYFASDQSNIIMNNNVICWIYGHSHNNKNINFNGKWLLTNQYGSYENPLYGFK